jgi:hypothetical protein
MVSGPRRRKGGHTRAVAGVPGVAALLVPVVSSRRAQVALGGATGLGLVLMAALMAAGSGRAPRAATVNVLGQGPAPAPPAVVSARAPRNAGDQAAVAYYQDKDAANARHVSEIVWTGPMLRVYTDLPASDADSKTAIALCETAAAYLQGRGSVPVVFVHANKSAGYPVLANKMDGRDDCRLNSVP